MTETPPTPSTPADGLSSVVVDTPIGALSVVASNRGLRAVLWPVDGELERTGVGEFAVVDTTANAEPTEPNPILRRAVTQLEEYFDGARLQFDLPLDPVGTEFQHAAWRALATIPFGETVSYGEQAERMGDRNKARAVGAANGKNPISIIVPCHRVVGSDGSLTGFAGGTETKRWLLDHEARVAGVTLV